VWAVGDPAQPLIAVNSVRHFTVEPLCREVLPEQQSLVLYSSTGFDSFLSVLKFVLPSTGDASRSGRLKVVAYSHDVEQLVKETSYGP
jgi:hypothetical protein